MKTSRSNLFTGLLLMAISYFLGTSAFAQGIPDLTSITSATKAGDYSMTMWTSLFGEFATNPFSTLGGPTTLLGGIFIVFNGCIFVVGSFWALYGIMGGIVATAHEGEVLGKRMSTIWFPIRMVTGISGMVPIFGGFTLTQAIMMSLTTIGIGIGNSMWSAAISNSNQMQTLMHSQNFSPTAVSDIRQATRNMFMSNICVIAMNESNQSLPIPLPDFKAKLKVNSEADVPSKTMQYAYGSQSDKTMCGYISAKADGRKSSSSLGFRNAAVNYENIENAATEAYRTELGPLQTRVSTLASKWYVDRATSKLNDTAIPKFPLDELDEAVSAFTKNTMKAITESNIDKKVINATAESNMKEGGWLAAGSYFSTFSEIQAGVADASKGPAITSTGPSAMGTSGADEVLRDGAKMYQLAMDVRSNGSGQGNTSKAFLDSVIKDSCDGLPGNGSIIGTATGNCSLGQAFVSAAIAGTAIGSGGGGSGNTFGLDSQGLVNPITMMKNMGDYVMTFSSTIILVGAGGAAVSWVAEKFSPAAKMASVAGKVGGDDGGGLLGKVAKMALPEGLAAGLQTVAMVGLIVGAAMSIYIPMIPFINWMGAILAYAASMIEGLAGAPLHAMSHLDGDGDGLGQKTTHGYMFYINALARPGLMIIGFFVASSLMITIGTLQAHLFLPAMANVQGNSVTGLFSIVAFLIIFFVMNVTLISGSFNLIYVITDQVIGFIGGQVDSKLGRDTEDKAHGAFMMVARGGQGGIGSLQGVAANAAKKKAEGLAGAAGDLGKSKSGK